MTFLAALAAALALACGCRRAPREPQLLYFNADHALSIRYPSNWTTDQAEQDGVWYRYFLAPPAGSQRKPAVSVTLLVSALGGSLDAYAQTYVAGNTLTATRDETRPAMHGKSWSFDSRDGSLRHSLLLLREDEPHAPAGAAPTPARVYGLYAQGETAWFEQQRALLEAMSRSLTLERAEHYRVVRDERFGWSLRVPPSWRETRHFSSGDTMLMQFTSPPLAADRSGQTVHASLTLSAEALPSGGSLDSFYASSRQRLGDAHQLLTHGAWGAGYVDSMRAETPLSASRQRRYYAVAGRHAYTLAFEARDDTFYRVARWCDLIAGTFLADGQPSAPAPPAGEPAAAGGGTP